MDAGRSERLPHVGPMVGVAVVGWVAFLWVFQHFFPNDYDPADSRAVFWAWVVGGTAVTACVMLLCFRVFRTPPEWRATAAVAMTAPALVLDMVATTFYGDWFGDAGPGEPAAYSATILGGTGTVLLVALAMTVGGRRRR